MTIYWTLKSVPELSDLSRAERGRLWRRYTWKRIQFWQNWVALVVALACVGLGYWIGGALSDASRGVLIGGVIGGGIGGFAYSQITIPLIRPFLRDARAQDAKSGDTHV